MIVSHEHKFIFLKTRKTAGTSIEVMLGGLIEPGAIVTPITPPNPGHRPRNHERFYNPVTHASDLRKPRVMVRKFMRRRAFFNHMTATQARARLGRRVWDGYFKFCFERDPWDKTVSWFYWLNRQKESGLSFDEYVLTRPLPSDFDQYSIDGSLAVDFVGKFEHLAADLRTVLARLDLPVDGALPEEKVGVRPEAAGVADLFDEALDRRVATVFHREIEAFGYRSSCLDSGPAPTTS